MSKIHTIINSRFSLKKYRVYLVLALCFGVVMILIGNRVGKEEKSTDIKTVNRENISSDKDLSKNKLEERLENILAEVSGVGKAKVLVSYESSDEKLVLKDSDGRGGESTVIYDSSLGNEPFIYKELSPLIGGVIVVAEGGDSLETKAVISDAISTVLGIPLYKVKVLKMK